MELQIAVPRTTEAGKIQNERLHRPAVDQQLLAGQNVKISKEMAMRSPEVDDPSESALRDDGERGNGGYSSSKRHRKQTDPQDAEHPYKGHRIDLTL